MKKKLVFASAVLLAAVSTAIGLNSSNYISSNAIAFENIEALSNGESGDFIPCYSNAYKDDNVRYTPCASCTDQIGWQGYGTEGQCRRK